jgi:Fe-S cluster assembly protein SufD
VQHATPNCESHQDYKGIFSDRSGVFLTGKFVEREAQKKCFSKSNNILLSDKATINAKPQLEIFADDVKCSRTVAPLVNLMKQQCSTCNNAESRKKPKHY